MNGKKEETANPNKVRTIYKWNMIFLSALTIAALVFAMFVFFRLRTQGGDGMRKLYSDTQIRSIRENAAEREKKILLAKLRKSLESGAGMKQVLGEMFEDQIVVMSEGKYSFYPIAQNVEKNPVSPGTLRCKDGITAEYGGKDPQLTLIRGTLISDDNGKIDWDRLSKDGIGEAAVRVGKLRTNGFEEDRQMERNCSEAAKRNIPVIVCIEIEEPAGKRTVSGAVDRVAALLVDNGFLSEEEIRAAESDAGGTAAAAAGADAGATGQTSASEQAAQSDEAPVVLIRIRDIEETSVGEKERGNWTNTVSALCRMLKEKGVRPMIGGSVQTFAAQIDISQMPDYDRWLIDHGESVSFPYSFSCWEYSRNGRLDGVPGDSFLYSKILIEEDRKNEK